MCADPSKWEALVAPPEGANSIEWPIEMTRASEAAARAFWPLGNTRLEKRLRPDRGADPGAVGRERRRAAAELCEKVRRRDQRRDPGRKPSPDAGHLAYLDQPEAVAKAVLDHLG